MQTQEAITLTSAVHADAEVAGNVVAERYRDTVAQLHAKFGDSFMVEHVSHALTATPAGLTPAGYIATVLIAYSFHIPPESPHQQTAAVGEDKPAIVGEAPRRPHSAPAGPRNATSTVTLRPRFVPQARRASATDQIPCHAAQNTANPDVPPVRCGRVGGCRHRE